MDFCLLYKCHPYGVQEIDETIFYTDAAPTGLKNGYRLLVIGCQYSVA